MKSYPIAAYLLAECPEMHDAMIPIHAITKGKVCDTGCALFDEGRCAAYRRLVLEELIEKDMVSKKKKVEPAYTIREEAAERGVSISRVRKERQKMMTYLQGGEE